MSTQVFGLRQNVVGNRTLHCVPAGTMRCTVCRVDRRRMRFYYTEDVRVFTSVRDMPHQRLVDERGNVAQYAACKEVG